MAAALGQAPFGLWPVALLGLAAVIWAVAGAARPGRVAWLAGAAHFAVALHWIVEPFLVDAERHGWMAPFALALMAGGLALFWGAAGWISGRMRPRAVGAALALAAAEMARGHLLTGFPWAQPAYIWTETPLRAGAAVWGAYGLSALTLVAAALPALWLAGRRRPAIGAALALALAAGATVALRGQPEPATGPGGRVLIVQPNVPQREKSDPARAVEHVERLIALTAAGTGETPPDLAIWPETAVFWPLGMAGDILAEGVRAAGGAALLTGINRRDEAGRWFNAAALAGPGGRVTETYDKVHLVPFGEYVPLRSDLIRALAAFDSYGFAAGAAVRAIDTPLGRAVPLICYEAIFPGHVARAGERPRYLVQLTNDGWFGTFAGPYQHLDQARFRAAEQGLPLLRAANTGVSAVIDARGRVLQSLPLGEAGSIAAELPPALTPTPYARRGDLPLALALAVALLLLAANARRNAVAPGAGRA